jgi:N6-adenosine-specific RNA methylase IME4
MKKYQIIYADPPWAYGRGVWQVYRPCNKGEKRFINDFYPTLSIDKLKELPITNLADKNCALFMWVTYSHLKEALDLISAWGFKYKTVAFVWVKQSNKGATLCNIGAWTMGNTEMCLIATRGNMLQFKKNNTIRQLVCAERTKHSKKPQEVRKRIEMLFGDLPRIELFARQKTEGWDVWGNEVESDIELGGKDVLQDEK